MSQVMTPTFLNLTLVLCTTVSSVSFWVVYGRREKIYLLFIVNATKIIQDQRVPKGYEFILSSNGWFIAVLWFMLQWECVLIAQ